MILRNRSKYASDEVRALVKFAVSEVDMRAVCVNVKNSSSPFRGMAYEGVPNISNAPATAEHLVTVGIGDAEHFPMYENSYRGASDRFPKYDLMDWREAVVYVAAHEAKHIEQFKENKPRSELACEHFAVYMLDRYRAEVSS